MAVVLYLGSLETRGLEEVDDCCWWCGCQWPWFRGSFGGGEVGGGAERDGWAVWPGSVLVFPERFVAIGGGVAPACSVADETVEGSGDGAGESVGGSGVR